MTAPQWPAITDEALVERLIPAVQKALIDEVRSAKGIPADVVAEFSAPDVANVLMMVLATVLASAPDCVTPRGIRLLGDAAGRELARLVRETQALLDEQHHPLGRPRG